MRIQCTRGAQLGLHRRLYIRMYVGGLLVKRMTDERAYFYLKIGATGPKRSINFPYKIFRKLNY